MSRRRRRARRRSSNRPLPSEQSRRAMRCALEKTAPLTTAVLRLRGSGPHLAVRSKTFRHPGERRDLFFSPDHPEPYSGSNRRSSALLGAPSVDAPPLPAGQKHWIPAFAGMTGLRGWAPAELRAAIWPPTQPSPAASSKSPFWTTIRNIVIPANAGIQRSYQHDPR